MENPRYRRYPRVYEKKTVEREEKALNLSAVAAVGILAATFVKGMFWGYLLKKRMG